MRETDDLFLIRGAQAQQPLTQNAPQVTYGPKTASEQQLEDYKQGGVTEYDDERATRDAARMNESCEQHNAERLRLHFADASRRRPAPPAEADPPPAETAVVQSERQKTKADKRREKQRRKELQRYGPAAEEGTLNLARDIRQYREKREADEQAKNANASWDGLISARPLSVDFRWAVAPLGDRKVQVQGYISKIGEIRECLIRYERMSDEEKAGLPVEQRLHAERLRTEAPVLERTLRLALMAKGVDYDTGGPVTPALIAWAGARLQANIAHYEDVVRRANESAADGFAAYADARVEALRSEPAVQEEIEAARIDQEERYPHLRGVPVAYHPYRPIQGEEYLRLRNAIDGNPEKYAEHKDVIDRMMAEYLAVWNRMTKEDLRSSAHDDLKMDAHDAKNELLERSYQNLMNVLADRNEGFKLRIAFLQNTMRYLLEGRELDESEAWMHAQLENEFGVVTDRRRAEHEAQDAAEDRMQRIRRLLGAPELADAYSDDALRIAGELSAYRVRKDNFERDLFPGADELRRLHMDPRALRVFAPAGYETDEAGRPLSEEDLRSKEAGAEYVREYTSEDPLLRARQLDRITEELLGITLNEDMATEEYICANALRIKQNGDKLCYIENVIKENPAYFENLPPERLRRLHAGARLYTFYAGLAISVLLIRGVEPNSGTLVGHVAPMQSARDSLPFLRAAFAERLAAYRREEAGVGPDPQGGA